MSQAPMDLARELVRKTRRKRELDAELRTLKVDISDLERKLLECMEAGELPESFKIEGGSVYTREQIWASPAGGDHARLTEVLAELGLVEYLPSTVNSHSISAYVREHIDPDSGEIVGLHPSLEGALRISREIKAVVNFTG